MRAAHGTIIITDPDAPLVEIDTVTCAHCNSIVPIKPGQSGADAGGFCMPCFRPVCGPCADNGRCIPFEAKLLRMEGRRAFLRGIELTE